MPNEKSKKHCTSCDTKYTITWNIDEQDLEPLTCPFCVFEVEHEEDQDEIWTNDSNEDDNWN